MEWLYYPQYLTLDDLKDDYERVHEKGEKSQLNVTPCKLPISTEGTELYFFHFDVAFTLAKNLIVLTFSNKQIFLTM